MTIGNPYVIDRPMAEGDVFVGRYKLLAEVAHGVRRGQQLVFIYGPDRAGKTSFLRMLARDLASEFHCLHLDFAWPHQGASHAESAGETGRRALLALQTLLGTELTRAMGLADGTPADKDVLESRPSVMPHLPREVTAVVLLDGLLLDDLRGEVGAGFLAAWQGWLPEIPNVRFVVTLNGVHDGANMFSPGLASLPASELTSFSHEETEELLLRAAAGQLLYEFSAIRRIWELTSGHPYLVQLLGYLLFNRHAGRARVRAADVEKAVPDAIALMNPVMERIWTAFEPVSQAVLVCTSELKGRHGVFTVADLTDVAANQSVSLSRSVIEVSLREWHARGVLSSLSEDSYVFASELPRQWLAAQKPTAETLVQLKFRKHLALPSPSRPAPRYFHWSTVALEMTGLLVIAAVIVLWNLRGSGRRVTMGALPTATAAPNVTRATLVTAPSSGRIAYMAKDDPDATWDIWVMRGDGSDPQRLTQEPADDMSPAWSPDGQSIAFVSERDGNREIYVMHADGTQPINLTHHAAEDWSPAWSPDGGSIAFSSYRDGNWEIYVMGADGSDPVRLTYDSAADYGANWSPDGEWIAFHSNRDGNWEIYLVGREGQELQRLTEDEATDFAPAWSPDGSRIAFESYRDGNMEIYVLSLGSGDWQNITNEPYSNEHGPAWARHGTELVYFSNRDGGWDLFSMNPDGTRKVNLTLSRALEQSPEWHE